MYAGATAKLQGQIGRLLADREYLLELAAGPAAQNRPSDPTPDGTVHECQRLMRSIVFAYTQIKAYMQVHAKLHGQIRSRFDDRDDLSELWGAI